MTHDITGFGQNDPDILGTDVIITWPSTPLDFEFLPSCPVFHFHGRMPHTAK